MSIDTRTRAVAIAILALATALLLTPGTVYAQATGATDIDINLPDVVILHYFTNVDLTVDQATLMAFLGYGGSTVDAGTAAAASFTSDLNVAGTAGYNPTGDPTAAQLVLSNAWAVRSIHLGGGAVQTRVSIAVTDTDLLHSGGGGQKITIAAGNVRVGAGAWGGNVTFAPPGIATPQLGDVRLTLDMSNATLAGDYQDGVFQLTAENI